MEVTSSFVFSHFLLMPLLSNKGLKLDYFKFCDILKRKGGLRNTKNLLIDEQITTFLFILYQNNKNKTSRDIVQMSGGTESRYFNKVFVSVIKLKHMLLRKPKPISNDSTDYRAFKWNPHQSTSAT
ncbi:DDE_4 domain-containing protein [Gossypium australe]|uniref:DDE_4 domain-containing protein n=1 Tax=Gossypium australe TaxID=47621 RepID=A0A5B6WZR4_9ROSI|nr:DDE_4 domain-containing protein [Gossypium australe]